MDLTLRENKVMANGNKVMRPEAERLVVKSQVRNVPLDKLNVDLSYQREEQKGLVSRIIRDYEADAVGVPLIGQREDHSLWIVDGQQRIAARRKVGDRSILAQVFSSEGPEHEAKVFRVVNAGRQKLSSGQLFKAALTEGDKTAWAIKECVEKCGFRLVYGGRAGGRHAGPLGSREVSCVSTMSKVARRHGTDPIKFALDVIGKAWQDDNKATSNYVLAGLAELYVRHEGGVEVDRLAERLNKTTPAKLMYAAGLGAWDKASNMCEVLERMYKKRLAKKV